jgi:hypothetical protein
MKMCIWDERLLFNCTFLKEWGGDPYLSLIQSLAFQVIDKHG